MIDYEVIGINKFKDPFTHFALFSNFDPTIFEVAIKESKWQKAMDEEIAAIERNKTQELVELPKGHKTIRAKRVCKTKLNENSEIDKYRVRLIAKGYNKSLLWIIEKAI